MNFLIDTCCLSELVKKKPDTHVTNWFNDQNEQSLFLSVLTFGELQKGVEKLPHSKKRRDLYRWIHENLAHRFSNRILGISLNEVYQWGEILAKSEASGKPIQAVDSLIVATASVHDLIIVTRNTKDMAETGVELFNPWNYNRS